MDSLTWNPLCGGPYVDSLTWTLLRWTPLRGAPYVDFLTWTLLMWTPYVEPQCGLSYMDPAYVDPPTWIPLRRLSYVDPSYVDPPLHGWFPMDPPYMDGFQNDFSQNGALIAVPWGPASKSPLSSNHTQSTGMLNMKGCQWQKL